MMLLLFARLALAHGGVDDEPAAKPVAASSATTINVAVASKSFDAVLRIARGAANTPVSATLLLADSVTSAPVAGATTSLALSGPATVEVEFAPSATPGIYTAMATFPAFGDYAGALVVTTPDTSDLLSVSGLHVDLPSGAPVGTGWAVAGVVGGLAFAGAVGLAGIGAGFLLGRRRGGVVAAAVLIVAVTVGADQVWAHGGEDHGGAASAALASPGGALALPMESQFLLGLRTERVVKDAFQDQVEAVGRLTSRNGDSATLRAPIAGTLVAPPGGFPAPGSSVHAGDVLAILQETPGTADRAAVAEQRRGAATGVAEAKKALALAERDAAQLQVLGDSLSERERLERQGALDVARERLKQAEIALASIGNGVSIAIRAPLAGRLGAQSVRPGDQVSAGDALFRVVDPTGLWMEARVPERLAVGLVDGSPAMVLSPAEPGHRLHAVVLDAGQEADPGTGTVLVTLAVEDEDTGLRPGMGATAWIGRGAMRDAVVVPDAAVVDSNGTTLAFVKTGPESFEMRELKLAGQAGDAWEIVAGLHAGERVVTDGTYTLRSLAGR